MIVTFYEPYVLGVLRFWGFGTLYMSLFALFVGMTRQYILRKGTLFFIISPDDPNTRPVHDALVKPLYIQLWRISQSALVYTLFIAVGIGGITFGLRATDSKLIPIRTNITVLPIPLFWLCWLSYTDSALLKKYIRQYWTRAFKACAAQLRLSSFILGKHDPKERGHVVYRNIWAIIRGVKPDFANPTTAEGSKDIFKTTEAQAVFVPDGYHVTAPKFDMATKSFIRTLFVPVTKDGIPLNPDKAPDPTKDYGFDEDSDEEDNRFDEFEVVYRPPNFGIRVIGLLVMLCVFAIILITGATVTSNIVGRPIVFIFEYVAAYLGPEYLSELTGGPQSLLNPQLDLGSIVMGLFVILLLLKKYDQRVIRQHLTQTGTADVEAAERDPERFLRMFVDMGIVTGNLIVHSICSLALCAWCILIHRFCNDSLFYFTDLDPESPLSFAFQLALGLVYTFKPIENVIAHETKDLCQNALQFGIRLACEGLWRRLSMLLIVTLASSVLPIAILQANVVLFEYLSNGTQYVDLVDAIMRVGLHHEAQRGALIATTPIVVIMNVLYKSFDKCTALYSAINAQVKEQYYSRGKTLENVQLDDQTENLQSTPVRASPPADAANPDAVVEAHDD